MMHLRDRFFSKSLLLGMGALVIMLTGACKAQYSDFFPYHNDGTPKPYVSMVPVYDESDSKLPWNVSDELTAGIRKNLMSEGKIYLPPDRELKKGLQVVSQKELTLSKDLMPFLHFQPAHFVIVLELIEHKIVPYQRGKIKPLYPSFTPDQEACVLMMKVRFKVVDIRGQDPKVIRQEIIESNHAMSKNAIAESIMAHSDRVFGSSELGIAHARLERDLAERIQKITSYQKP